MSFTSSASFIMLSLRSALGVPPTKIPIDGATFVFYVLPPVVCNFILALLVVTPQTRTVRIALYPLVALLALRAALSIDMSGDKPKQRYLNIDLVLSMLSLAVRSLDWTLAKGPLKQHCRPANSSPSTIKDALNLISNVRGLGWEWSRGLYIPPETRPTNRMAFVSYTLLSAVAHAMICGACHRAVLSLVPMGTGSIPGGSTIFDETLPFVVQYFRATVISIVAAFSIYSVLQMSYDLGTIPAILLGQDPAQWPPIFDAPWRATSLSDFWGKRWHQLLRQTFLVLGGYPLSFILGPAGTVIGAFLASAVLHHIAVLTLNSHMEIRWMLVGFGMMGPGVLAERAFYQLTGRRVGGVVGWVWTMGWLLLWGNVIIEGFARAGMFGCADYVDRALPVRISVERLVKDFDVWLHTL